MPYCNLLSCQLLLIVISKSAVQWSKGYLLPLPLRLASYSQMDVNLVGDAKRDGRHDGSRTMYRQGSAPIKRTRYSSGFESYRSSFPTHPYLGTTGPCHDVTTLYNWQ